MRPTQHRSSNDVLGAPPGVPHEECTSLAITRVQFVDGNYGVVSFWQPSEFERKLIAEGKPVRLCVMGQTHPPLSVGVDDDGVMDL